MVGNVPMRDRDGRWRKVGERGRYGRCRRPVGYGRGKRMERRGRGKVRKRRRGERRKKDDEGVDGKWKRVEELAEGNVVSLSGAS
jgi:hypothetical protein